MTLNQIYSCTDYVYAVTTSGLAIYNLNTDVLRSSILYEDGFTTVSKNSNYVYLGTTSSGIKYLSLDCVDNTLGDLSSCLNDLYIPNITSSGIKYIHANDNQLIVCTSSGVDYYNDSQNPIIHSKTYIAGAEKCFATTKAQYYTVSGSNEYSIYRIDSALCDWVSPSFVYTTGSGIFEAGIYLTDIFVTTQTAYNGGNTIFCTTSSGVYIIDEDTAEYASYYIGQI